MNQKNLFKALTTSAFVAMAFASTGSATAAVVYDNGPAIQESNRCAEDSGVCNGSWTIFDDFSLSSAQTITNIHWTAKLTGGLSDFNGGRAWIYNADPVFGGGSLLYTIPLQASAPTLNSLGNDLYDVSLNGLNIALSAGTYWLGMQNDTNNNYATLACSNINTCYTGDNSTQWQNDGSGYRFNGLGTYAFSLEANPVPVPAAAWLLGSGLLGLIGVARRKVA